MAGPISTGNADKFPIKIFETDVNDVVAGTAFGGWVSGSPANLAAASFVDCIFDLGQDWHQYGTMQVSFAPSGPSVTSSAIVSSADTPAYSNNRRLQFAFATGAGSGGVNYTTTQQSFMVRPMGRYNTVRITNTDASNALGSCKVTIAAYPT